jgi:hemolysin III
MTETKAAHWPVEEVANTITHGFGLVLSLAGLAVLVALAATNGGGWHLLSAIVYGLSLVVLYAASTFYHGAKTGRAKDVLQLVDHCCIYLLIAGTYTPFTLIALKGGLAWTLFGVAWSAAVLGIVMKVLFHNRFKAASVISYLLMGWIGAVAVYPLAETIGWNALLLVIAGGVSYTAGTIFYGWHSLRHHHAIWHLFVLGGSALHFAAVAVYVMPFVI